MRWPAGRRSASAFPAHARPPVPAYTDRVPVPSLEHHAVDRYLWFGDLLGFARRDPEFTIRLPPETMAAAEELLGRHASPVRSWPC